MRYFNYLIFNQIGLYRIYNKTFLLYIGLLYYLYFLLKKKYKNKKLKSELVYNYQKKKKWKI